MGWDISGREGRGGGSRVEVNARASATWSFQYLDQDRASCMRREFIYTIKVPTLPTLCLILGWTV